MRTQPHEPLTTLIAWIVDQLGAPENEHADGSPADDPDGWAW